MQVTIVGLPGVGKTTVFNALTGGHAETGGFSGGRAAPNLSVVKVPDERVDRLAALFVPKRTVYADVTYVDVAIPAGAAREGTVNPDVLAQIRNADALLHEPQVATRWSEAVPAEFRFAGGQFLADFRHRPQHCFGQLLENVKLANLMRHIAENLGNRPRIQARSVGRDAFQSQSALLQQRLKPAEETLDVGMRGVMVQDLVGDPPECAVVHDREYAERAIIQLVGRDVSGEVSQYGVQIVSGDVRLGLFFPRPRPSSGWWRKGQTRGGPATDANWRCGRASRPPPPAAPPTR
jgi:hypothetical protein